MTELKTAKPLTVLYRGTLEDTAVLVGLANTKANVELIAYTGDLTPTMQDYFKILDRWLSLRGLPTVSIHPNMKADHLDRLLCDPLKDWGWKKEECGAVVYLSGLPFPPLAA